FSTCEPTWAKPTVGDKDFYDPTLVPLGDPKLPSLTADVTLDALDKRRSLVEQVDRAAKVLDTSANASGHGARRQQAFELRLSATARRACDLEKEPLSLRERYGRDLFGSSTLLARRLVESGVTFVAVHTEAKGNGHWDTHENNFNMLRQWLLPFLDRAVSAL